MARPKTEPNGALHERRTAILKAAERIFSESGLAGARTDAIVREAGVNKALLYYYFKSKSALYQAVIEDHFREFNQQALAVLAGPGSARAVLLKYVSLHFDFICSRQRYAVLYQQLMIAGGKELEKVVQLYFVPRAQALGAVLERGMRDGEFRLADVRHTAVSITAMIVFYFSASRVLKILGNSDAYSEASLKQRKQEVIDFIRHGLFADPNAPLT